MQEETSQVSRFRTLEILSHVVNSLGWITAAGGGLFSFIGMVAAAELSGRRGGAGLGIILAGVPGLLVVLGGVLVVAAGQTIACFVSIERNTRAAWETQKAVLKALGGDPSQLGTVLDRGEALAAPQSAPAEPSRPVPPAVKPVVCPNCQASEAVQDLHDVGQYKQFEAVDKSRLGFQSVSLTCKKCGCVFRV